MSCPANKIVTRWYSGNGCMELFLLDFEIRLLGDRLGKCTMLREFRSCENEKQAEASSTAYLPLRS